MQSLHFCIDVKHCWQALPLDTIARSYAGTHQIVSAIVDCDGGDDFVRAKNGLSFSIRKHCVPYYNDEETSPAGVEMVSECIDDANGVMARSKLKWTKPDVTNLQLEDFVDPAELKWLYKNLPVKSPDCKGVAAVYLLTSNKTTISKDDIEYNNSNNGGDNSGGNYKALTTNAGGRY